jgi:lysophospholipase L1-like esterase
VSGAYVDGVHPTSHGFALMAENLALQLRAIRLQRKLICG